MRSNLLYATSIAIRYSIAFTCWFLLGIGSALFHATQTGWGEFLDEIGMVASVTASCFTLQNVHPLTTSRRGSSFYIVFSAFVLLTSIVYAQLMYHPFFTASFFVTSGIQYLLLATLPVSANRGKKKLYREVPLSDATIQGIPPSFATSASRSLASSGRLSFILSVVALAIWHVDQLCVHEAWPIPSGTYEIYWYYWTHPLWHVLTAMSLYFFLETLVNARVETNLSRLARKTGTGSFITVSRCMKRTILHSLGLTTRNID